MRANKRMNLPGPRTAHRFGSPAVLTAILTTALACTSAQALQFIEASDGVSVEAILSIKEPTRIRIEGSPITDVFGNIHSSHCGTTPALPLAPPGMAPNGTSPITPAVNGGGDVVLECDHNKGEVYNVFAGAKT